MSETINHSRRRILGATVMTMAAAQVRSTAAADRRGTVTGSSFGPLKQINAGVLNVGYAEVGPAGGPPGILLHGWPYDIHTYLDVAPLLAAAGYRVIVPPSTRLWHDALPLGQHVPEWSAIRTRCRHHRPDGRAEDRKRDSRGLRLGSADGQHRSGALAGALQGYGLSERLSDRQPGDQQDAARPPKAELEWWYQFYFATERGRAGYEKHTRHFANLIWQLASPQWHFDDATFDRSAASLGNPDHVAIVIHNYRWRLGLAEGEQKYDPLEKRLAQGPIISVPTITLEGDANGAPHADASAYAKKFSGKYAQRVVHGGVGHNLPQEAPRAFAEAVVEVDGY